MVGRYYLRVHSPFGRLGIFQSYLLRIAQRPGNEKKRGEPRLTEWEIGCLAVSFFSLMESQESSHADAKEEKSGRNPGQRIFASLRERKDEAAQPGHCKASA